MTFKEKVKDCHLIVRGKLSYGEKIDEQELDRFLRIYFRGFLKPKKIKSNVIEYTGPIGISLYERLKKPITKKDFFFIIEQIVIAYQKLQSHNLPMKNWVTAVKNVYINEYTKEVQFIYYPTLVKKIEFNLIEFIETIVYSATPGDLHDNDFVSRFNYFFKEMNPINMNEIEKFIFEEDRDVVNTLKRTYAGESGSMKHIKKDDDVTGLMDDDVTGLMDNDATDLMDDATGLIGADNGFGVDGNYRGEKTSFLYGVSEATGLLNEGASNEEGTALLNQNRNNNVNNAYYPILHRILTDEIISINKSVYRLGKEKSYVDYFVDSNPAVSRSHADIITRNNRFFVKDLNSKNHTYINDHEIQVNCETELHNGDYLKLANEVFIFKL